MASHNWRREIWSSLKKRVRSHRRLEKKQARRWEWSWFHRSSPWKFPKVRWPKDILRTGIHKSCNVTPSSVSPHSEILRSLNYNHSCFWAVFDGWLIDWKLLTRLSLTFVEIQCWVELASTWEIGAWSQGDREKEAAQESEGKFVGSVDVLDFY